MLNSRHSQFLACLLLAISPASVNAEVSDAMNSEMKVECRLVKQCNAHGDCHDQSGEFNFTLSGNEDRHGVGEYKMMLNGVAGEAVNMSLAGPLMWQDNEGIHMLNIVSFGEVVWTFRPDDDEKDGWVRFLGCSEEGV